MSLGYDAVQTLQNESPVNAWASIFGSAWDVCSQPIDEGKADAEVAQARSCRRRFRSISRHGWLGFMDRIRGVGPAYVRHAGKVVGGPDRWPGRFDPQRDFPSGSPVVIGRRGETRLLDSQCAGDRRELPADTTPFAKSLGFSQRSALGNNGAGDSHKLTGARTDCTDIAWEDCAALRRLGTRLGLLASLARLPASRATMIPARDSHR